MTGPEIKAMRMKAGIDQGEVSTALGLDQSTYAKYENSRRSMPSEVADQAERLIREIAKARAEAVLAS